MTDNAAPLDDTTPLECGRALAQARERCGLSVGDVARQIKLSPGQVEAIEAGNYSLLPKGVFARGFIRNYARAVNLDAETLLASLPQTPVAPAQAEISRSVDIPFPTGRRFKWVPVLAVLLVFGLIVGIFVFYGKSEPQVNVTAAPPAPSPLPVIADNQAPQPVASKSVSPSNSVAPADAPTVVAAGSEQNSAPSVKSEADTSTAGAKPQHVVKLSFAQESWVEIRDGTGHKIFSQLNPAGTEQAISGSPPLSVIVGNAGAVRLNLNDQPIDLGPYTKVDVARITLE